jgi:hypothetical protein
LLAEWLDGLAEELREKKYQPGAVKRVWIPKPEGEQRPLEVPCIRDRVVQMAAVLVLGPIFEEDFPEEQYGYRPGRGAHEAIRSIHRWVNRGHGEVVDADLRGYIGTRPSKKRVARFCQVLHGLTERNTLNRSTDELIQELNLKLKGWANYFCLGAVSKAYRTVDSQARLRLRRWLRKQHKRPGAGTRIYSDEYLYERLGLVRLEKLTSRLPGAKAAQA